MEPGGSMSYSQGPYSNSPYPEPNKTNSSYWYEFLKRSIPILSSHLGIDLPKDIFPVVLPVKILKVGYFYLFPF